PMGPPPIWLPAALWAFYEGSPGLGVSILLRRVRVSSVATVANSWLISQGSDMPFLLRSFGVLAGALTLGLIHVVSGPNLLAVGLGFSTCPLTRRDSRLG